MSALGPPTLRSVPSERGTSFGVRSCSRQRCVKRVLRHPFALEQRLQHVPVTCATVLAMASTSKASSSNNRTRCRISSLASAIMPRSRIQVGPLPRKQRRRAASSPPLVGGGGETSGAAWRGGPGHRRMPDPRAGWVVGRAVTVARAGPSSLQQGAAGRRSLGRRDGLGCAPIEPR